MTGFYGDSYYGYYPPLNSGIGSTRGGVVRMGQMRYLHQVDLSIGGTMDTSEIVEFGGGSITADGVTADFTSLVGSSQWFNVGTLSGYNLSVINGGNILIPSITELDFSLLSVRGNLFDTYGNPSATNVSFPTVTTLNVSTIAVDGWMNSLDLSTATSWQGWNLSSSGGASLNLSGLTSLPYGTTVNAAPPSSGFGGPPFGGPSSGGGSIGLPNLTTSDGISFIAQSGGTLNLSWWTNVILTTSSGFQSCVGSIPPSWKVSGRPPPLVPRAIRWNEPAGDRSLVLTQQESL